MSIYLTREMIAPGAHLSRSHEDGTIRRLLLAATQQWQRRRMITTLEKLDDRILADIGIHRSDIHRLVAEFSPRALRLAAKTQAAPMTMSGASRPVH